MTFSVSQPYFNPRSPHGERRSSQPSPFPLHNFNPRSPHGERPPADRRAAGAADFNPRSPHGERRLRRTKRLKPTYFNPRSPHGERPPSAAGFSGWGYFNPRSPHGERRGAFQVSDALSMISIHAPRTGSDISFSTSSIVSRHFNPRSPHGERRPRSMQGDASASFQSTLPARGATGFHVQQQYEVLISIHAPRTGSDLSSQNATSRPAISIHAPRTGSDNPSALFGYEIEAFQSTLPARGATRCFARPPRNPSDFNPRSPHGERRAQLPLRPAQIPISIHAPRTGSDVLLFRACARLDLFQSTLPARGATGSHKPRHHNWEISIHAPRTGSDLPWPSADSQAVRDFNPRSPHGERLDGVHRVLILLTISIHAPRTGSDSPTWA